MHVLHLYDCLGPEDAAALSQAIAMMGNARHTIAAATPIAPEVRRRLGKVAFAIGFPPLAGKPSPARLRRLGAATAGFDLVLTHGYDAIDAAMAQTLFGQTLGLPPLVHHEAIADPARSRRRDWYRRIALGRAAAVIVPTERLRATALADWQQPAARIRLVPPGADLVAMARKPRPDALPRLIKRRGERWLGGLGDGDPAPLLDTLARLPDAWQLVWFGDGPAREAIREAAMAHDLAHRVHMPGAVSPAEAFGLMDLLVFTGDPAPATTVAAMAAGLAIVAPAGGETGALLAPAPEDATINRLVADEHLRRRVGDANLARARAEFDARRTIAALIAVYREAAARAR